MMQNEGLDYGNRYLYDVLNDLSDSGYLIKKKDSKFRTYDLNPLLLDSSNQLKDNIVLLKYFENQMDVFNEMNLNEQVNFIHNIFVFLELIKLKESIELFENPEKEFAIRMNFDLYEKSKMTFINFLIENLKNNNKKYTQKVKKKN